MGDPPPREPMSLPGAALRPDLPKTDSDASDAAKRRAMLTLLLGIVVFLAGTCVPTQVGVNTQLAQHTGNPIFAAFASFLGGTAALLFLVAVLSARYPVPGLAQAGSVPWWAWVGGPLGVVFVTAAIFIAPIVGVAAFTAFLVAGQLCASLLYDHFGWLGFAERPITWERLLGAALLIGGVVLIRR